jgi:histidine triad (HIT) family protein
MADGDCLVCRKHQDHSLMPGGAIYEDDLLVVAHAGPPVVQDDTYLGYLMLETRRHTPALADLSVEEAMGVGVMAARLAQALQETESAEHVYAFVLGDGVAHFHMHIVPRYPGAPREYYGSRVDEWPDAPRGGSEAITAVCDRLRAWLAAQG